MTDNQNLQTQLLDKLIHHLGGKEKLIDFYRDNLAVTKSSVYRRLNGDTDIGLAELQEIQKLLQVSLDDLMMPHYNSIRFAGDAMRKMPKSFKNYLENVQKNLQIIASMPDAKCLVAGSNLPPFHFINKPRLYFFKLYYWNSYFWQFHDTDKHFDLSYFQHNKELIELCESVCNLYYSIPSFEIWTNTMFDSILAQIVYFLKIDAIREEELAVALFEDLLELTDHLEEMCKLEKKYTLYEKADQCEFSVFHHDIHDGADTILFESEKINLSFIRFDGPNYIRTQQNEFADYTKNWINTIRSKSSHISGPGEKERKVFFKRLKQKITDTKENAKVMLLYGL